MAAGKPIKIAILADAGPASKSVKEFGSDTEAAMGKVSAAAGKADRALDGVNADKASRSLGDFSENTDDAATRTGIFASALGAFAGGLEAVGLEKYAAGLQAAAIGADVFSNASDVLTLALESKYIKLVRDKAATLVNTVATKASAAASKAAAAGQWLLNAALTANPIGLVVLAVVALVAGLVLAYKKSETFRKVVDGAFAAVKKAVSAVVTFFTKLAPSIFRAVGDTSKTLIAKGKNLIFGIINGYNSVMNRVAQFFRQLPGKVGGWLGDTGRTLVNKGKSIIFGFINGHIAVINQVASFFGGLRNKIYGWIGDTASTLVSRGKNLVYGFIRGYIAAAQGIVSFFGGLGRKINGWVGNLGSALYGKGREVIQGLINGITSKLAAIGDAMKRVTDKIGNFLPGSPVKEGALRKWNNGMAGKRLIDTLTTGIKSGTPALVREMAKVSSRIDDELSASPQVAIGVAGIGGAARPAPGGFGASGITINVYALTNGPEVGRSVISALRDYERVNGTGWREGKIL